MESRKLVSLAASLLAAAVIVFHGAEAGMPIPKRRLGFIYNEDDRWVVFNYNPWQLEGIGGEYGVESSIHEEVARHSTAVGLRLPINIVINNGSDSAPIRLDVFIDPICPDSRDALDTLLPLAHLYGPQRMQLTSHLLPLPYHRAAWLASKVAFVLDDHFGCNSTYPWLQAILHNITNFKTSAIRDNTDTQVLRMLSCLANKVVPGSEVVLQEQVNSDRTVEHSTRVAFKYASSRAVVETPTFHVNGVLVAATGDWTAQQWRNLLDPLLDPELAVRAADPEEVGSSSHSSSPAVQATSDVTQLHCPLVTLLFYTLTLVPARLSG